MVRLLLAAYLCTQAFGLVAREESALALEKAPLPAPAVATPQAAPTYAPAPVVTPFSAKILRPILGETASQYGQHQWWVVVRTIIGWIVLAYGVWMWTWWLPSLYFRMHEDFLKEDIEGRSFQQYLTYHFNYWMTSGGIGAMFKLLGIGILTLLTIGAFIYAILMQDSPVRGLWLCTVWASAASVDPAVTAMEGGVGMLLTFGGLVLLAVLLTTISDFFAAQQKKSNEGRDPIVEGGHLVLLGLSSQTKDFLEELAICEANSAPKTIAILDTMPKSEIEEEIKRQNTNTGDLKIVCRGGLPSSAEDLWKVGADVCSRIVILDEPSLPRDEADSIAFGTLLTLRGQGKTGWPNNGHISVQCCLGKNVGFMNELYPGKTFVLSGERLGRLMVQSARDQGLCPIFNAIIGFEGDEFYAAKALDIGVVGRTFQEVPFWCEKTVPIGIRDASGAYIINPEKSYKVKMDDEVIVLAEDDDAIQRMSEPMMDFQVVLQFLQEKELFETLLAMEGETGVKYSDGDLPVASILQSSLDMFSAADAAPAEKEDADGKAACEALEALRGGACATREADSGGPDAFAANVTAVCWAVRSFDEAHCIVATADRKLRLIGDHEALAAFEDLPSPPLSLDVASSEEAGLQEVLVTTMGGETLLLKLRHPGAPSGGYPDSKDMGRWSFELCQRFKDHQKQVTSGRFAPARSAHSSYFITISRDHTACVYGRPPGPHFALLGSYSFVGEVTACCWLDPLTAVLAARNDHELHYLEMEGPHPGETQEVLQTNLNALGDSVVSFAVLALAASPDGAFLAACTDRARVILLQARSPRQLRNFYGAAVGEYDMPTVAFSLDGCFLYVSSSLPQPARRDEEVKALCGQVAIFEVRSGQMVLQLPCHEKSVRCFHRHPYSEMLVTGSFDKMVKFWS